MSRIEIRFYAELNDFLPRALRVRSFPHEIPARVPLRDIVEGLGVPHTEVDLVLVNGESVSLDCVPAEGARVSVYPVFETLDVAAVSRVRPEPLREPKFVLDVHLGRLAAYLRMAGFDAAYSTEATDEELAHTSAHDHRILLTRDQGLLKRRLITHGSWVRATAPEAQFAEVVHRFDLSRLVAPFTRCLRCNAVLQAADPDEVCRTVPPRVRATPREYSRCPSCGRVYWAGSHHARMRRLLERTMEGFASGSGSGGAPSTR